MIETEPIVTVTAKYPIGKASKILGINRKTLYNHTIEGFIKCGFRKASGRRFYTGSELLRFWKSQY